MRNFVDSSKFLTSHDKSLAEGPLPLDEDDAAAGGHVQVELVAGLQRPRHRALLPGRRGVRRAARAAAVAQRTWRQGHRQQGPGTALLGAIADCGAEADEVNAFPVKDKITTKLK